MKDNFIYRRLDAEEVDEAIELAARVFDKYEAPSYGENGTQTFIKSVKGNSELIAKLKSGELFCAGAFDGGKLVGMLATRLPTHITTLFVEGEYHRRGIATRLMDMLVAQLPENAERLTVNASPYGLPFYVKYGFVPTDSERVVEGIIFTPMELILKDNKG